MTKEAAEERVKSAVAWAMSANQVGSPAMCLVTKIQELEGANKYLREQDDKWRDALTEKITALREAEAEIAGRAKVLEQTDAEAMKQIARAEAAEELAEGRLTQLINQIPATRALTDRAEAAEKELADKKWYATEHGSALAEETTLRVAAEKQLSSQTIALHAQTRRVVELEKQLESQCQELAELRAFKGAFDKKGGKGSGFWKERCLIAEKGWAKTLEDFAEVEKELAEAKQTITARAGKVAEAVQAFRKVYVAAWHLCDATEDCSATEELGGVPIVKTEEAKYAALEDALDETEKLYDRWFPSISPALKSEAKEPKP